MAKLMEKTGAEMAASLVNIAAPLKRFMDDQEFNQAFTDATKKGLKAGMTDVLQIYTTLIPLMLGDAHLKDTLAILAEIEGTSVREMLKMNGTELIADIISAFNDQLKPFFIRLGLSVGGTP